MVDTPSCLSAISPHLSYQWQEGGVGSLYFEQVSLRDLARGYGTPLFVYSARHIADCLAIYQQGFASREHTIYYSVKVNSNLHLLRLLYTLGSKFDVVSQGELQRVLAAGGRAEDCVFSGVGKTKDELLFALQHGIDCINVESAAELYQLNALAQSVAKVAPISLRINPDIDAKTHPYISTGLRENKFGILMDQAGELYQWAHDQPYLRIKGISCHIGSQLLDLSPLLQAAKRVVEFAQVLVKKGIDVEHVDLGGGIGISYQSDGSEEISPSAWQNYFTQLRTIVPAGITIHIEPGRSIVGNGGVLLMQVQHLKNQESHAFVVVDAAMNDVLRPALYRADHQVLALRVRENRDQASQCYNVVGPVCESADFLAHDKKLSVEEGDYLALLSAGAYCFCMSSNYNSRLRAAEVLVDGKEARVIRQRETFGQMIANEIAIPFK